MPDVVVTPDAPGGEVAVLPEAVEATVPVGVKSAGVKVQGQARATVTVPSQVSVGAALDLAPTLGSLSTHARSGVGPAPLRAGDALPLSMAAPPPDSPCALQALAPIPPRA